ncbi:hypothetical protein NKJ84_19960, partial [Mesorhizobium sp. M0048]
MTYCVGLKIDRGLVFMSDTRTNAGMDSISTFRKMHVWEEPGERVIVLMSAGNLATTQAVVSLLDERTKAVAERRATLLETPSIVVCVKFCKMAWHCVDVGVSAAQPPCLAERRTHDG